MKTTRKQLQELATVLEAQCIAKNIYTYENEVERVMKKEGLNTQKVICFSVSKYGNSGRIDMLQNEGKTKTIFVYY